MFTKFARRSVSAVTLCLFPAVAVLAAPAVPTVEPRVSSAAGAPCVVTLFTDQPFDEFTSYSYAPPPGCPGPWSKVVLKLNLGGSRAANTAQVNLSLGDVSLFNGSLSQTDDVDNWHVERDLTDYAALLHAPRVGTLNYLDLGTPYGDGSRVTGSAKLMFYRSTAGTPAHRVPDRVVQASGSPQNLPHNIVRAYLDVTARAEPLWYTCVPNASAVSYPALLSVLAPGINQPGIFPQPQGCTGGSFREVEVSVDGTPAGVVPVFPWLPSDLNGVFHNALDTPVPGVQVFNLVPYRVDLTPFAAILSDAGPHTVTLSGNAWTDAQLLLYLDHGSAHVTGAVTLNTLTDGVPTPVVTNSLSASGNVLEGNVGTEVNRQFEIHGFVNTSHGRINSVVKEKVKFSNFQGFHLDGLVYEELESYWQNVWLQSTVDRHSRRTRGSKVLSNDHEIVAYPLTLHYATFGEYDPDGGDGPIVNLTGYQFAVDQKRHVEGWHRRPGMPWYATVLNDRFVASHDMDEGTHSHWNSLRRYGFKDSFGSCYKAVRTSANGVLTGSAYGSGCPGGSNHVRWYAHADGSPDAITWRP